jgi:glucose-1-phosphate cytidylyltransferase
VKVVLFCGGMGLRLREVSESIPKPMVTVGYRPILWHVMRYYAHFGHRDFVLCLGYRADTIKDYFLRYAETISNDFVLSDGGRSVELLQSDIQDWRISFIDTGLDASIGQRLRAVSHHLGDDDVFLANYGDCLTDAPQDELIEAFLRSGKLAAFLAVRPLPYTFHLVDVDRRDRVTGLHDISKADLWINGGYFIFRKAILDEIGPGEDLVPDVLPRLIERGEVLGFRYDGFWAPMDTLRDWQKLESYVAKGHLPWAVWQRDGTDAAGEPEGSPALEIIAKDGVA